MQVNHEDIQQWHVSRTYKNGKFVWYFYFLGWERKSEQGRITDIKIANVMQNLLKKMQCRNYQITEY